MSLSEQSQQWYPTSVQVTVLQARGLRIKGKNGTNDAYAIMQVAKDKFSTSVSEKSVAPVWKEEASFDLPMFYPGNAERCTLQVSVMHRALVGSDKMLGQATVNLLELYDNKSRNKSEWFKLMGKTGKADKDRGEVLLDIQFMKNNMTASMFDLSGIDKSRSRLGKIKDKLKGKKKDGMSDSASAIVPSVGQVMTDSEGEEEANTTTETKKKSKLKSLFAPKGLHRNFSQSMSTLPTLPEKDSAISLSRSSGLNVESPEGKKKFKLFKHKRTGSSDSKVSQGSGSLGQGLTPSLCINGSHVYAEEPETRDSRAGSTFSLNSSGHGSMEDLRRGHERKISTTSMDSNTDQQSQDNAMEQMLRRQEEQRKQEEEARNRLEEEKRRRIEEEEREQLRRENIRKEEERKRIEREEERKLIEREEERSRLEKLEEERRRMEREEERKRIEREEERKRFEREEEKRRLEKLEEERKRIEREEERKRFEREEEKRRLEKLEEEMRRMEREEERKRIEREEERKLLEREMEEQRRIEEEEEMARIKREHEKVRQEEEEKRIREERKRRIEEEERTRLEKERLEKEEEARRIEADRRHAEEEQRLRKEKIEAEEKRKRKEEEERRMAEEKELKEQERLRMEKEKMELEKKEKMRREEERKKAEQEEEKRKLKADQERIRQEKDEIEKQKKERELMNATDSRPDVKPRSARMNKGKKSEKTDTIGSPFMPSTSPFEESFLLDDSSSNPFEQSIASTKVSAVRPRPHAVKPLSTVDNQADFKENQDNFTSAKIAEGVQVKMNVAPDAKGTGPYAQLTHEELVNLLERQKSQLSQKDTKIMELEQYIDNLLVRVMEEQPSILMSLSSMKKSV